MTAIAPVEPERWAARRAALARALLVTRREIRDTVSDWRVVAPMLTLALLFPLLLVAGMHVGVPYMTQIDPESALDKVSLFGAMMAAFFPISFSLVIALESFVGEKERNTLEALLATPISDGELFLGKLLAVMAPPVVLSNVALAVYVAALWLVMDMAPPLWFLALAVALSTVEALAMVAGAVVVSSHTSSVKAANLLASFIIIPVALTVQAEVMLLLLGHGRVLWFFLIGFVAIAAMLIRMGIAVFNREEILTREGDELNLRLVAATFLRFLHRTPANALALATSAETGFSVGRLYRRDIPELVRLHTAPLAVVSATLLASTATGFGFAQFYPLDLRPVDLGAAIQQTRPITAQLEVSTLGIFVHNLKVVALAGVLSVFSFGVVGLVVILSAFLILGFLAGEGVRLGIPPTLFFGAFVLPHGLIEIPAVVLAGAFSLRIGLALMAPPRGCTVGDSLMLAVVNWLKGAALFIPLLLAAAWVETNVTPLVVARALGGS